MEALQVNTDLIPNNVFDINRELIPNNVFDINTELIPNNVFDTINDKSDILHPIRYNITDNKLQLLYEVLNYCLGITESDVFKITINYINRNPSFDEFSKQTFINALYNSLEVLNITSDDSMFMAYYRAMRYLLPYINQ
jgi:hypothetical protein